VDGGRWNGGLVRRWVVMVPDGLPRRVPRARSTARVARMKRSLLGAGYTDRTVVHQQASREREALDTQSETTSSMNASGPAQNSQVRGRGEVAAASFPVGGQPAFLIDCPRRRPSERTASVLQVQLGRRPVTSAKHAPTLDKGPSPPGEVVCRLASATVRAGLA